MLNSHNTLILVVDIQERLLPVLHDASQFVQSCCQLITGTQYLQLPVIITEQYPKGLGQTIQDIHSLCSNALFFEKTLFSAYTDEVQAAIKQINPQSIILIGCETHICILQTALALWQHKFEVYIPQECVASRTLANKNNALQQMQQAGVIISNIETLLFQLLQDAKHPQFKVISKLIQ